MDCQSRKTASTYINNLLLSRGLLRNGSPIDFATPEQAQGGVDATMSQVMNLVHDLVLRRDRESDILASLSQNLQSLKTSSAQNTQKIARLETRNSDIARQLALATAQERSAMATVKTAETRNRALREEIGRLKSSVGQVRAQCATDVRRRDGEIQRLKRHLEGRRGRDGNSSQVGVVVVTPGVSKGAQGIRHGDTAVDLDSPAYSLKQETTEFLTQLSQNLSDENDALISLVKGTLATLKSLQGLPDAEEGSKHSDNATECDDANRASGAPPSYEVLATNTDEVLEHLRTLLTNPSFVPLEEVEVREEEIHRLRNGWEKMAARWKEAMTLLDGWKKRMVNTGDTINLDDLDVGMQLGSEIPSARQAHEGSLVNPDETLDVDESGNSRELENDEDAAPRSKLEQSDGNGFEIHANHRVLSAKEANVRTSPLKRKVSFQSADLENQESIAGEDDVFLLDFSRNKVTKSDPVRVKSRIPLQKPPKIASPVQTVEEKLEYAQAEAEEARKLEDSKPRRKSVSKQNVTKKLRGSRRRSTLSPEELENLISVS